MLPAAFGVAVADQLSSRAEERWNIWSIGNSSRVTRAGRDRAYPPVGQMSVLREKAPFVL